MKAMFWSGIIGFAEPLGALIGMAMLTAFTKAEDIEEDSTSLFIFGILFGLTAGIMTSVAIKQLLLEAVRYDPTDDVTSIAWAIGALVIAISLIAIAAVEESSHC